MNNTEIYNSHCAVTQFEENVARLEKSGYHVVPDYFFENTVGEKFIRYCYYPKGDIDKVKFSPVKKNNPCIDRVAKENLHYLDF